MVNLKNLENFQLIIKEQSTLLQSILEIEKNKNAVLIKGKLSDFATINSELMDVINNLESVEKKRIHFLNSLISENTELPEEFPLTFSTLLSLIKDTEYYSELNDLYENVKKAVEEIKYFTSINRDLIEAALNVLNITLSEEKKDIDYTGRTENNHNSSLLVNRII